VDKSYEDRAASLDFSLGFNSQLAFVETTFGTNPMPQDWRTAVAAAAHIRSLGLEMRATLVTTLF
jgi:hypothetical protein